MTSEEMQTSGEADSEEHFEAPKRSSVYDFLYQDVRRVGSFLAQFDEYGVRQSVKATESVGKAQAVKGAASGTLGLPSVMEAAANIDVTTTDDSKDIAEHTFDPLWANSRRLLDYLTEHNLISSDLWELNAGSFVLVRGSIIVVDLDLLKSALGIASVKEAMVQSGMLEHNIAAGTFKEEEFRSNVELLLSMPSNIQIFIYSGDNKLWATLTNESLATSTSDLIYKHGSVIRGMWNIIGILDAFPDIRSVATDENPNPKLLSEYAEIMIPNDESTVANTAVKYANAARDMIGRPKSYFGLTPLLIFREVSGE